MVRPPSPSATIGVDAPAAERVARPGRRHPDSGRIPDGRHHRGTRRLAVLTAVTAVAATGSAVTGAGAVIVAVVAGPGPRLAGYVSEAGIAGNEYATAYRAGIFGLAAALLLLALALTLADTARVTVTRVTVGRVTVTRVTVGRVTAGLLAASAAGTVVSGAVTCSDGCPLPPFEAATSADLVHGGASVAAVACAVFAMFALTRWPDPAAPVRRLAVAGAVVAFPLSGAVGVAMLALGRGPVVGLLERLLLLVVVLWVAASGLRLRLPPRAPIMELWCPECGDMRPLSPTTTP